MPYKDPEVRRKYNEEYRKKNAEKAKERSRAWYQEHRAEAREKQQQYHQARKEECNARKRAWSKTPEGRAWRYREWLRYKAKYPEKQSAHDQVAVAIKSGKLVRQPCEVCGELRSKAHHEDYSKPLEVIWLCAKHHHERHKKPMRSPERVQT